MNTERSVWGPLDAAVARAAVLLVQHLGWRIDGELSRCRAEGDQSGIANASKRYAALLSALAQLESAVLD